ncbi:MAG: hypothetical protein U5N58_02980 [Actinomycetota bacterium]|nr:hypothetical protein [Actinomycetota bacterium]
MMDLSMGTVLAFAGAAIAATLAGIGIGSRHKLSWQGSYRGII